MKIQGSKLRRRWKVPLFPYLPAALRWWLILQKEHRIYRLPRVNYRWVPRRGKYWVRW